MTNDLLPDSLYQKSAGLPDKQANVLYIDQHLEGA